MLSLFPELGPDRLIERIETGAVGFADPANPAALAARDGELVFKAPFLLRHTTFADARSRGIPAVPRHPADRVCVLAQHPGHRARRAQVDGGGRNCLWPGSLRSPNNRHLLIGRC